MLKFLRVRMITHDCTYVHAYEHVNGALLLCNKNMHEMTPLWHKPGQCLRPKYIEHFIMPYFHLCSTSAFNNNPIEHFI